MKNANMPAMPQSVSADAGSITCSGDFQGGEGFTKREELAARAMQGLLSILGPNDAVVTDYIARDAVECADALLAELVREAGDD